jgi:hypothetical protein
VRRVVNAVPLRSASPHIEITSWRCNALCRWHWKHNSWSRMQIKKHLRFIKLIGSSWELCGRNKVHGMRGAITPLGWWRLSFREGGELRIRTTERRRKEGTYCYTFVLTPLWAYGTSQQHWPLNNSPEEKWEKGNCWDWSHTSLLGCTWWCTQHINKRKWDHSMPLLGLGWHIYN